MKYSLLIQTNLHFQTLAVSTWAVSTWAVKSLDGGCRLAIWIIEMCEGQTSRAMAALLTSRTPASASSGDLPCGQGLRSERGRPLATDLEGWEEGAERGEVFDLPPATGTRRNWLS